jgi:type I restriction enzyme S subunit
MPWSNQRLGDYCEVIAGQSPEGKYYNDKAEGLPFYQGKKEFGDRYIGAPQKWTTKVTKEAKADDILMSVRAPVGPINFSTEHICIGRGLAAIRPSDELDKDFLFYYLLSKQDEIQGSEGAVFASINKSQIQALSFSYVNLEEQKRIVAILDQAFADINKARALTEQNLKNARELFESYLQQVFGQRGEGWTESELFDHVKFIDYRGRTPKKTESGLKLITAKNVRMGYLKPDPEEFVAPDSYDEWMTRGIPQKGDVLFTTEAPLANVAQLDIDEKVVFAQRIITMQPDRSVLDCNFLKYLLMSQPVQKKIHEKGTGATATGIKASLLKKIPIEYPSDLSEQSKHVQVLDKLTSNVTELETIFSNKLGELDELKKSLLQKAFTGELTSAPPKNKDVA